MRWYGSLIIISMLLSEPALADPCDSLWPVCTVPSAGAALSECQSAAALAATKASYANCQTAASAAAPALARQTAAKAPTGGR